MSDQYVVRSSLPVEIGSIRDGVRQSVPYSHGFQIHDTFADKRLPDMYMSRAEAQAECDRRNGR